MNAAFLSNGDPRLYCTPEMVRLRRESLSLCCDPECDLSGGYAHAVDCEPCGCGLEHAMAECDNLPAPHGAT
jgi:hypothetical protein